MFFKNVSGILLDRVSSLASIRRRISAHAECYYSTCRRRPSPHRKHVHLSALCAALLLTLCTSTKITSCYQNEKFWFCMRASCVSLACVNYYCIIFWLWYFYIKISCVKNSWFTTISVYKVYCSEWAPVKSHICLSVQTVIS